MLNLHSLFVLWYFIKRNQFEVLFAVDTIETKQHGCESKFWRKVQFWNGMYLLKLIASEVQVEHFSYEKV